MTKYEELLAEYEDKLHIEEHPMHCDGLYADGCVWINSHMTNARKACILAEEAGHYETSVGNILDMKNLNHAKQEHSARIWAYKKLLSIEKIYDAAAKGYTKPHEMAEYLDVDEEFLRGYLHWQGILDISV